MVKGTPNGDDLVTEGGKMGHNYEEPFGACSLMDLSINGHFLYTAQSSAVPLSPATNSRD